MRKVINRFIVHFMPIWITVAIPILTWIWEILEISRHPPKEGYTVNWNYYATSFVLAHISFWTWAITTNACGGHLVSTGGRESGKEKELRDEFPVLLFFGFITLACYIASFMPLGKGLFFPPMLAAMLPFYTMGRPKEE